MRLHGLATALCDKTRSAHPTQIHSSTLHQWSRADPAFLLEETQRRARGEEKRHKAWYAHLLESVYKRDSYPDSKVPYAFVGVYIYMHVYVLAG